VHGPARFLGRKLATFLSQPKRDYERFTMQDAAMLRDALQPGDVLLVEGETRMSTAIQYLTQSTWSHSAFYAGPVYQEPTEAEPRVLIEAELVEGVVATPLSKYADHNVRICRPMGLTEAHRDAVVAYMVDKIGLKYDLKNIFDLMRYLLPTPPVPRRMRRKLLAFGSGEPTKAICSSLIVEAFHAVDYPILPLYGEGRLSKKHPTHFVPRDFDLSPYFKVVKPTVDAGFDYRALDWEPEPTEGS
jgi:hypothetical protein